MVPKYTSYVAVCPSHVLLPPLQVRFVSSAWPVAPSAGDTSESEPGPVVHGRIPVVNVRSADDVAPLSSLATTRQ